MPQKPPHKPARKPPQHHCDYCGKAIQFVTYDGARLPCDAKITRFIPNENGQAVYYTVGKNLFKGDPATDGRDGFKVHRCNNAR